jgi:hypothetical protein
VSYNPKLYRVVYLERLPLQTPYPAQVAAIARLMGSLPRGTDAFLDFTGVGRGIYDMFIERGLQPRGVTMTGGHEVHHYGDIATVPKSTLVSKLVALIHGGELRVHTGLSGWPILQRELLNYRSEVTPAGHETWNSRTGEHDDLIVAIALCVWGLGDNAVPFGGLMRWYDQQMGQSGGVRYCVGVDLGQAQDYTAICVMCRIDNPSLDDVRDGGFRPA